LAPSPPPRNFKLAFILCLKKSGAVTVHTAGIKPSGETEGDGPGQVRDEFHT